MQIKLTIPVILISTWLLPVQALAHHSVTAEYDTTVGKTIEGVVTRVWYRNPHVRYYLAVKNEQGKDVIWNTHGHNLGMLHRMGWNKDTIKVGDKVTMTGDSSRKGLPKIFIRTVMLADGTVMKNGPVELDANAPAELRE